MSSPYPQTSKGLSAPPTLSQDRLALDNLIRRELKVGDPSDPVQVAQALLERYRADPRAQAIRQESLGMPGHALSVMPVQVAAVSAAGGAEWKQAVDDIERDLRSLTTDAILKDVTPELLGWAQAIRVATQEGYDAARMALDPRSRDKGFAMRRQLNDYARLARLVGAHTPAMLTNFRKFAQSLDEAANLLLVLMGEALSNVGFGGGRYVPQVAYTDLQTRRDAVIYALRNLVGSTQMAYGPEDWPRGLDAYRQLLNLLESQGQGDLRSLLVENELARTMDELVQRSGDTTAEGLRAVGATAMLALERFRRLIVVARRGISPESPALYAFLEALQLFATAFDSAGGFRLMKIARPPILFYGLYGSTGLDDADRRLIDLVTRRGLVADGIDCVAGDCCMVDRVCLVLLDKALYDIDRAIDLYALGYDNFGAPELRAAAYGYVIDEVMHSTSGAQQRLCIKSGSALYVHFGSALLALQPKLTSSTMDDEMKRALSAAQKRLSDNANASVTGDVASRVEAGEEISVADLTSVYCACDAGASAVAFEETALEGVVEVLEQELCLQRSMESRWSSLVHSLVANCSQIDISLAQVQALVDRAVKKVIGRGCTDVSALSLPPTLETSFDTLVEAVDRDGKGRPYKRYALGRSDR